MKNNNPIIHTKVKIINKLIHLQEYEKAINLIAPILTRNPDNFDFLFLIGSGYMGLKKYNEGLKYLMKAYSSNPHHS